MIALMCFLKLSSDLTGVGILRSRLGGDENGQNE